MWNHLLIIGRKIHSMICQVDLLCTTYQPDWKQGYLVTVYLTEDSVKPGVGSTASDCCFDFNDIQQHGFKYQAIVTPDGLVMSFFGPFEGKANDNRMAQEIDVSLLCLMIMETMWLFCLGTRCYPWSTVRYPDVLCSDSGWASVRLWPRIGNWVLNVYDTTYWPVSTIIETCANSRFQTAPPSPLEYLPYERRRARAEK